jgi:rhodanese-related sulfurtransferase
MTAFRLILLICSIPLAAQTQAPRTPPASQPSSQPVRRYTDISVDQFQQMMKQPNTVVLDVRTQAEYAEAHIAGAVLLNVNDPEFAKKIAELDKSKTYLVHCRSGVRSVTACNTMSSLSFPHLYNMVGGITAWQAASKPVEK